MQLNSRSRPRKHRPVSASVKGAACATLLLAANAFGVEKTWLPTSGTFSFADSANWGGGTPASGDVAVFNDNFAGKVLLNTGDTTGSLSFRNTVNAIVLDTQGHLFTLANQLGLSTAASQVNDVTILGGGSINATTSASAIQVGFNGSSGNHLTFTGANTQFIINSLNTTSATVLGVAGSNNNTITISNGARFQANSNLLVGVVNTSSGNVLEVNNATYTVNTSARGVQMINGTLNLTDAYFESTTFLANAANSTSTINFNSGTFYSRACTISNGKVFQIGDGVSSSPATFVQSFSAPTLTASNGVLIKSNGRIEAYGTIVGDVSGEAGAQATPENNLNPNLPTDGTHFATITDTGNWNNTNIQLKLEPGDLTSSVIAGTTGSGNGGLSSDRLVVSGGFTHGGTVLIDMARYIPQQDADREIKLISWGSQIGAPSSTSVSFINGTALTTDFRSDGLYLLTPAVVANSTWNKAVSDGSNTWRTATNWTGAVPYGIGGTANFGPVNTEPMNIGMAGITVSVGTMNFSSPISYTIGSGNTITMDVASGNAGINVSVGSHSIDSSLALNDSTVVNVAAGATMTFNGGLTSNGPSNLTMSNSGDLILSRTKTNTLNVTGGTVHLKPNGTSAGITELTNLTMSAGTTLDIANNGLVVNYSGSSVIGDIKSKIVTGYASGAWTGPQITSASAAAVAASTTNFNKTGIGYAEASALGSVPDMFSGATIDSDTVLVRYTLLGDANLDGTVNVSDFVALANGFNRAGNWVDGDFNYDGVVNAIDFNYLATNFGAPLASPLPAALGTLVPEPATLGFIALGLLSILHRRRNS